MGERVGWKGTVAFMQDQLGSCGELLTFSYYRYNIRVFAFFFASYARLQGLMDFRAVPASTSLTPGIRIKIQLCPASLHVSLSNF